MNSSCHRKLSKTYFLLKQPIKYILNLTVSIQLFCQEANHILLKCHIPRKQCDGAAVWEWFLLIKLKPRKIASSYFFNWVENHALRTHFEAVSWLSGSALREHLWAKRHMGKGGGSLFSVCSGCFSCQPALLHIRRRLTVCTAGAV